MHDVWLVAENALDPVIRSDCDNPIRTVINLIYGRYLPDSSSEGDLSESRSEADLSEEPTSEADLSGSTFEADSSDSSSKVDQPDFACPVDELVKGSHPVLSTYHQSKTVNDCEAADQASFGGESNDATLFIRMLGFHFHIIGSNPYPSSDSGSVRARLGWFWQHCCLVRAASRLSERFAVSLYCDTCPDVLQWLQLVSLPRYLLARRLIPNSSR